MTTQVFEIEDFHIHDKQITITVEDLEEPSFEGVTCSLRKLGQIFTTASVPALDDFYSFFDAFARKFRIDAEVNENFFLAQVLAEIGTNLGSVRENLNYSCSALKSTFGYYKRNPGEANADGRCENHSAKQINIGNKAYANRIGNGSVSSGDGYLFRGGGFFQLTGRGNYQAVVDGIEKYAEYEMSAEEYVAMITEVGAGLLGAMSFWEMNKMYNCTNIDCTTKIINRHTDSYAKRKAFYLEIAAIPAEGKA